MGMVNASGRRNATFPRVESGRRGNARVEHGPQARNGVRSPSRYLGAGRPGRKGRESSEGVGCWTEQEETRCSLGAEGLRNKKLGREEATTADPALRQGGQGVVPEASQGGAGPGAVATQQGPRETREGGGEVRSTYWGPSARRHWGSPPGGEGRGSPGRPGGPGRSRTGQWSRPWLREPHSGTRLRLSTPKPLRPTAAAAAELRQP